MTRDEYALKYNVTSLSHINLIPNQMSEVTGKVSTEADSTLSLAVTAFISFIAIILICCSIKRQHQIKQVINFSVNLFDVYMYNAIIAGLLIQLLANACQTSILISGA